MSSSIMVRGGTVNSGNAEDARQFWLGMNTAEGQKKKTEEEMAYDEFLTALALGVNVYEVGSGYVAVRLKKSIEQLRTDVEEFNLMMEREQAGEPVCEKA